MADGPGELSDADLWGPAPSSAPPSNVDPISGQVIPAEGLHADPRMPGVWRDGSGKVAFVGSASTTTTTPSGATEVSVNGSADPEHIAKFLKAHPELESPPEAAQPTSGAPPAKPDGKELSDADIWGETAPTKAAPLDQAAKAVADSENPQFRSLANGAFFGFQPELKGAGEYIKTVLDNMKTRAQGGTPAYSAADAFTATQQAERNANQAFAKAHPIENTALGLGGAIVNPVSVLGGEVVGAAPTALGALGRGAMVGAAEGAVQGAGDAGGNLNQRAEGALMGGATGAAVGGALGGLGKAVTGALAQTEPASNAAMSAAVNALKQSGVDYDRLWPQTQDAIKAAVARGQDPTEAAFRGLADTLPEAVPLSAGQASGKAAQQFTENQAARGVLGNPAAQTMNNFRAAQQEALRTNAGALQNIVAGGRTVQPGQAGVEISNALNTGAHLAKGAVDLAYDTARAAPEAKISPDAAAGLVANTRKVLDSFDPQDIPKVSRHVAKIEELLKPPETSASGIKIKGGSGPAIDVSKFSPEAQAKILAAQGGAQSANPSQGSVEALFKQRARLSQLRGDRANPVEAKAAGLAIKEIDKGIQDAVANDLLQGDPRAVQAWTKAIRSRAAYGKLFEGDDLIQRLTEKSPRGGDMRALSVDPQSATNYILGRQNLVGLGNLDRARDLQRLGEVLGGEKSPAWQALKGEVFSRLMAKGEGPTNGTERTFSGAGFANAWRAAKKDYPNVINKMFTDKERSMIDQFSTVAERATKTVQGGASSSNSDIGVTRALQKLGHTALGVKIPMMGTIMRVISDARNNTQIQKATFGAGAKALPKISRLSALSGGLPSSLAAPRAAAGVLSAYPPPAPTAQP